MLCVLFCVSELCPVIWDFLLEPYRDVTLKEKPWIEIAKVFLKDSKYMLVHQTKTSYNKNPDLHQGNVRADICSNTDKCG